MHGVRGGDRNASTRYAVFESTQAGNESVSHNVGEEADSSGFRRTAR